MDISIISVVPEIYKPFLQASLLQKAQEKGILKIDLDSFFSFVEPKERIDASIYGPGAGMLIRPQVVEKAIEGKEKVYGKAFKIFFSPQGKSLDQRLVQEIAWKARDRGHLMLLPARYEGMDTRVEEYYADSIVSVGNFVMMGGDLAAMMLLETVVRYIPGVVGKQEAVTEESFSGPFVEYPHYTEPLEWKGMRVPEILRSGNHAAIEKWRMQQAAERTVFGHFDWLRTSSMTGYQRELAQKYIPHHYCAFLQDQVLVDPTEKKGVSLSTSTGLYDLACLARMYGLKRCFLITPLPDQQQMVNRLFESWQTKGREYDKEVITVLTVVDQLDTVIDTIEKAEGSKPLIIAASTSAVEHAKIISFYDQQDVWTHKRPILFIFDTDNKGFDEALLAKADFLLKPIKGFSDFTHISVRSVVSIVLDRWLGINEKDC
ncbi:tRNA (guanosine(37)-N1)-methyltransferase TrmD [Candidatus Dependentiae bacterium]|nr:MAG: tRNA (guanosine(37)-N1)-methyltransferase TrmD [Candidatus Dependentiae bacterium]